MGRLVVPFGRTKLAGMLKDRETQGPRSRQVEARSSDSQENDLVLDGNRAPEVDTSGGSSLYHIDSSVDKWPLVLLWRSVKSSL
jgi:hypothetical protein